MASIIVSPRQRFAARVAAAVVGLLVFKWIFFDSTPKTRAGEIAHPDILERITLGTPLSGQSLDTRKYPFLQSRINRDETHDVFDNDIDAGMQDFWTRFQKPFMTGSDTMHLDEQVVRGAIDELLGFNGWAAAACSSLTRPFGISKRDDDWSDLARPGALYYFALVVHGADHFLIDQLAVIVQLAKRLGPTSVFVSIVDYASVDSTPFLCDLAEMVMTLLGISFRIRQVPPMTADPTASYYPLEEAYTRNLALEPLQELWERRKVQFERVIWLKGFTCPNDILETIRVSVVNQASMVCSMDWKEHNGFFIYNDRWRTRDMDGNLFRGSKSTSPIDEAPPRDAYGGARYTLHLPFQVFCCESGTHIVDPHKSYYLGLTYHSSVESVFNTTSASDGKAPRWSEGPCMDSAQLHFCRDMWMASFQSGIRDEAKRLHNDERMGKPRNVHPFMDDLIQAMLASYAPATTTTTTAADKVGYPNSGDYLADETGAAPGGGPGNDNSISKALEGQLGRGAGAAAGGGGAAAAAGAEGEEGEEDEDEEYEDEEIEEGSADDVDDAGKGRPVDLAVDMVDDDGAGAAKGAAAAGAKKIKGDGDAPVDADEVAAALDGPNKAEWDAVKPDAGPLAGQADKAGPAAWAKVDAEVPRDQVDPGKVAAKEGFAKGADAEAAPPKWFPAPAEPAKKQQQKRSLFGLFGGKGDDASTPRSSETEAPPSEEAKAGEAANGKKRRRLDKRRPRSLPNSAFPNAIAKILVNPRCVTTYAGVSHTQLALDLFGSGEDREPTKHEGGKYVLDEWRTAPESFVCQEMRTTGGRIAPKQQRRTGFQQARLLLNGWRPT
ncbi:cryptococcal mannosyltransferase 1-domain-containing protein [Rhodotorula diobovata]|uniref:Cryptococcal mannosyltransferase 1-domain-containing protein n=1 Tax=Rhodotorula diobovata TaxID=5288 RepID=A0A5C5FZ56_9BASI|nr:cryptococcal mannosyltransferase 1-domain-containing protein [Rhodotorula diobovata]